MLNLPASSPAPTPGEGEGAAAAVGDDAIESALRGNEALLSPEVGPGLAGGQAPGGDAITHGGRRMPHRPPRPSGRGPLHP